MATNLKPTSNWYSVPAYQVENPAVWKPIEAILDCTCEEYRTNDVRRAVAIGEMELWVAAPNGPIEAVLLTEIARKKIGNVLTVLFCGGSNMNSWIDECWRLTDYAKQQNCVEVRFEGREGWKIIPGAEKVGVKWRVRLWAADHPPAR